MFLINAEHQNIQLGEGAIFSLIAILIVFIVLVLIICCVTLLSKVKFKENEKPAPAAPVMAAPASKKLTIDDIKDEDMMVAALVATAEFVEETKEKDARLVSIKQIG